MASQIRITAGSVSQFYPRAVLENMIKRMWNNNRQLSDIFFSKSFRFVFLLSLVITSIMAFFIYWSPLIDSDTFEFGTVARSLWENGTFSETAIRAYGGPKELLKLPHPADHRANFTAVFLVPFYALFRESQATFAVPYLLMFFFTPLIMFFIFRKWFGEKAAVYGIVYYLFLPRLWFYSVDQDMGNADIYNAVFVLLSLYFFSERKYVFSGFAGAIAAGFKSTGGLLIPAYFGYWLLFDRSWAMLKKTVLLMGILAIPIVLTGIRSAIVFGNPFFNEEMHFQNYILTDKSDKLYLGSMLCDPESPSARKLIPYNDQTFLQNLVIKIKALFVGKRAEFGYFPGVFESVGYYVFPFFLIGVWIRRNDPIWRLLALLIAGYIVSIGVLLFQVEDRHFWFLWLTVPAMAFSAIQTLAKRWRHLGGSLLWLCIISSMVFLSLFIFEKLVNDKPRKDYLEYLLVNRWITENTSGDDVVMSVPYWSPAFYHRRNNMPFPLDNLAYVEKAISRYRVRYLMLDRELFPQPVPFSENMSLVLKGNRFEVIRVNDFSIPSHAYRQKVLADYVPAYSFWSYMGNVKPPFVLLVSSATILQILLGSYWQTIVIVFFVGIVWLLLYPKLRSRWSKIVAGIILFVLTCIPLGMYFQKLPDFEEGLKRTSFNPVEVIAALNNSITNNAPLTVIGAGEEAAELCGVAQKNGYSCQVVDARPFEQHGPIIELLPEPAFNLVTSELLHDNLRAIRRWNAQNAAPRSILLRNAVLLLPPAQPTY
ncbi:MAG TPA: glycosyltransferase family 39 protein [bacterium]|nr:glycosyltransferase family 39 protein [bacterium]